MAKQSKVNNYGTSAYLKKKVICISLNVHGVC